MASFSHRETLAGTTLPLGAGSSRYLTALDIDPDEAAALVRKAEPVVARMAARSPGVVGGGSIVICEALALARGVPPDAVAATIRQYIPREPLPTSFLREVSEATP